MPSATSHYIRCLAIDQHFRTQKADRKAFHPSRKLARTALRVKDQLSMRQNKNNKRQQRRDSEITTKHFGVSRTTKKRPGRDHREVRAATAKNPEKPTRQTSRALSRTTEVRNKRFGNKLRVIAKSTTKNFGVFGSASR